MHSRAVIFQYIKHCLNHGSKVYYKIGVICHKYSEMAYMVFVRKIHNFQQLQSRQYFLIEIGHFIVFYLHK